MLILIQEWCATKYMAVSCNLQMDEYYRLLLSLLLLLFTDFFYILLLLINKQALTQLMSSHSPIAP